MIAKNLIFVIGYLIGSFVDQTSATATANQSENCSSWPSDLKSLAECCDIPYHNDNYMEQLCEEGCTAHKDFKGDHKKCVLECYVTEGTELLRSGKFNKACAASLYKKGDNTGGLWTKIIEAGVSSCSYESNGTLKEKLTKYFGCVDDYLTAKCIRLKSTDECFKVFNHVEECSPSSLDCSKWPENLFYSSACCKMPQVLEDISSTCDASCAKKEISHFPLYNCRRLCDSIETGLLKSDGSINFDKASENLQKSELFSEKWEQPVMDAIDECKGEIEGKKIFSSFKFNKT